MNWLITYTIENDYNAQQYQQIIKAGTYTEAYLLFSLSNDFIILDIQKYNI